MTTRKQIEARKKRKALADFFRSEVIFKTVMRKYPSGLVKPFIKIIRPHKAKRSYPKGLRELVYKRDDYKCVVCGATENLTLDHIQPVSKRGETIESNLKTLCLKCNSKKHTKGEEFYERACEFSVNDL